MTGNKNTGIPDRAEYFIYLLSMQISGRLWNVLDG